MRSRKRNNLKNIFVTTSRWDIRTVGARSTVSLRTNVTTKRALTLAEILISVSLIALVSVSIFKGFANGLKVWDRSRTVSFEEDAAIFLEQLSYDLRNAFTYSKISFEGGGNYLRFPTFVKTMIDAKLDTDVQGYRDQIGQVEYAYDPVKEELLRKQANYSQAIQKKFGVSKILLDEVKSFQLRYYYSQGEQDVIELRCRDNEIPAAIFVELVLTQGTMSKFISIPRGS